MRIAILLLLTTLVGCSRAKVDPTDLLPELEPNALNRLAQGCTVLIEREGAHVCLGTVVQNRSNQFFVLSASDLLKSDNGYTVIQWEPSESGQKFTRQQFDHVRIVKREPAHGIAVLTIEPEKPFQFLPVLPKNPSSTTAKSFEAWAVVRSQSKPVERKLMNVVSRLPAQDVQKRKTSYWRLDSDGESGDLGGPLLDQKGRLIGVAVKVALRILFYLDDVETVKIVEGI